MFDQILGSIKRQLDCCNHNQMASDDLRLLCFMDKNIISYKIIKLLSEVAAWFGWGKRCDFNKGDQFGFGNFVFDKNNFLGLDSENAINKCFECFYICDVTFNTEPTMLIFFAIFGHNWTLYLIYILNLIKVSYIQNFLNYFLFIYFFM